MVIQLFDVNWQPISNLIEASSRSVTRIRVNQATAFSFTFPSDSAKSVDLDLAAHVLLLGRLPGRITQRRVVGGEVQIDGLTLEDRLNDIRTPRRWVGWNDRDLADVVRDLLRPIRFVRWSTAADWQGAVEKVNVDLDTEPGSVLLATDLYLGVPRYRASGYIVLRAQLPATALPTGKIVRWTERVGSKTRIRVQTRAASTLAELTSTPWGPELEALHAEGVEENETKGVPVMDGGPWVDIRLNLYTDDRDTYDNDENPTIMGFTPILDGVELIWREPPVIGEGSIPASTGAIVRDTEYNRVTHLRALVELCERYQYTFRIRLDGATPVLDLAPSFGVDRSADVLFVNGENAVVELRDTDQETSASGSGGRRVTVLHCWGAGSGADQLYVRLEDPELIARYGVIEDDFEDTSITDLATLQTRGAEEFERRKRPFTEAVVETTAAVLADAWLQDIVRVIDPASGTVTALEIREIQIDEDAESGEIVRLGLGAEIVGLVDAVLAGRAKPSGLRLHVPPLHASVLRAEGMHEAIRLTWTLVPGAESYDLEHSTDGATWELLASDVPALSYDHRGLVLGSVHWYRVYAKRAGTRGPASNVVRQTAKDVTPPAAPANMGGVGIIRGIAVRWAMPTEADYDHTEIRVGTASGFDPEKQAILAVRAKGNQVEITEGLTAGTRYYVRARHVDTSGNVSAWSAEASAVAAYGDGALLRSVKSALVLSPPDFAIRLGPDATKKPTWPIQKIDEWGTWLDIPGSEVTLTLDEPALVHYIVSGSGAFQMQALSSGYVGSSPLPVDHCANIGVPLGTWAYDEGSLAPWWPPEWGNAPTDEKIVDALRIKLRILIDGLSIAEWDLTDVARLYGYTFGIERPSPPGQTYCFFSYDKTIQFPLPIVMSRTLQLSAGVHTAKAQALIDDGNAYATWGVQYFRDAVAYKAAWVVSRFTLWLRDMSGFALVLR